MTTIRFVRKGPGGGKTKPKRITRSWMIGTILAQQAQLDKFSQLLLESQTLVNDLQQQTVAPHVVVTTKVPISMPTPNELAPSGTAA